MRKGSLLIGIVLLISGIISAAVYVTTTRVAYADTVAANAYLTLGVLCIILGFIFLLSSVKIPKVRVA